MTDEVDAPVGTAHDAQMQAVERVSNVLREDGNWFVEHHGTQFRDDLASLVAAAARPAQVPADREYLIELIGSVNYPRGPLVNSVSLRAAEVIADALLASMPGAVAAVRPDPTDEEVEAAARAFAPAWWDSATFVDGVNPEDYRQVHRGSARAALIAAHAVSRG